MSIVVDYKGGRFFEIKFYDVGFLSYFEFYIWLDLKCFKEYNME